MRCPARLRRPPRHLPRLGGRSPRVRSHDGPADTRTRGDGHRRGDGAWRRAGLLPGRARSDVAALAPRLRRRRHDRRLGRRAAAPGTRRGDRRRRRAGISAGSRVPPRQPLVHRLAAPRARAHRRAPNRAAGLPRPVRPQPAGGLRDRHRLCVRHRRPQPVRDPRDRRAERAGGNQRRDTTGRRRLQQVTPVLGCRRHERATAGRRARGIPAGRADSAASCRSRSPSLRARCSHWWRSSSARRRSPQGVPARRSAAPWPAAP